MFERLQKARQASGEEGGSDEEDRTAGNGSIQRMQPLLGTARQFVDGG
jgi:hypothetical protein